MKSNRSRLALLGLLSRGPASGYDLKKQVEELFSHFWNESYGQIYPILKQLAADGLAVRKAQRQTGKPDRLIYSITRKGQEMLRQWLEEPAQMQVSRNEILMKLLLTTRFSAETALAHIERYRDEHLQRIGALSEQETSLHQLSDVDALAWNLTLMHERQVSRAVIRWCDEAKRQLRAEAAKGKTEAAS